MQNCAKRQTNTKRWVKPISPAIVRQLNIIQGVFKPPLNIATGFPRCLIFPGHQVQGSIGGRRERSLEGDELERILKASNAIQITITCHCNHLGIDTEGGIQKNADRRRLRHQLAQQSEALQLRWGG